MYSDANKTFPEFAFAFCNTDKGEISTVLTMSDVRWIQVSGDRNLMTPFNKKWQLGE